MAWVTGLTFLINLTIVFYGPCVFGTSDVHHPPNSSKDGHTLESTLQGLLGLQNIPHSASGQKWTEQDFDVRMAPKYMLDLYEKYRSGGIHSGKQVANTVRSIQAQIGVINSDNKFVFNLSSIVWSEKIIRAEIHLYKRRSQQSARQSDITMDIHELGPTFIRKLDHRRIPEASYGWQAADVTTAVQACRHYSDGLPRMVAVTFSAPHRNGQKSLSIKTLIRRISRPYLVVYSNDTQNITVDHIQPHISPLDLTSSYVDPSTGILQRFSTFGRDKRDSLDSTKQDDSSEQGEILRDPEHGRWFGDNKFFKYFPSESHVKARDSASTQLKPRVSKVSDHNEVYSTRIRRSVLDNEIPGTVDEELDPDEANESPDKETGDENRPKRKHGKKHNNVLPDAKEYGIVTRQNGRRGRGQNSDQDVEQVHVPRTHPGILQGRTSSKHKTPRNREQLIPYPEDYKKKRRRNRKNRRKERRQNKTFRASRMDWGLEDVMTNSELKQMCSKRTLTVDFADIGWSEWIISPRSFEANYCSGSCPFPLAQKVKPSNHATIQSLVRAIGLNSDVPNPCCVPDKLSSVTLLYFDESKNVVLKNYPDMSVDSCACR